MLGLFSGELIFGGAYYWKEFCVSNCWVGLDNKNSLKHYENSLTAADTNSRWEGLILEGFLRLRFVGLIFGRAYFIFIFLGGGRGRGKGAYYRNFTVYTDKADISTSLSNSTSILSVVIHNFAPKVSERGRPREPGERGCIAIRQL